MKPLRFLPSSLAALLVVLPARADVRLPAVFRDHAVLQRDVSLPVWGWADPGEKVRVALGERKAEAVADEKGRWRTALEPLKAGGPLTLTVEGRNRLTRNDILVGEVWLCSGQSNMAMTVNRCRDYEAEKAAAKYPQIRMFKVTANPERTPQDDCSGDWSMCSPDTVGSFSATAYFFGREVHQKLGVPVGLINSSVGGTAIEAWTSMDAQKAVPELAPVLKTWDVLAAEYDPAKAKANYETALEKWKKASEEAKAAGKTAPRRPRAPVEPRVDNNHPANLYNGMIAPLVGYAIRGALWYQGERNARSEGAALYRVQLPVMIRDWRARWGQGDFPVYWVQLPNFKQRSDDPGAASDWAVMRESMLRSLAVPNTGMAVAIDVGEANDIHPKNKQDVGKRLALAALAKTYRQDVAGFSPLYRSHTVAGNEVTVRFDHADGGLLAKGNGEVKGFAIAGTDRKWRWAKARIEGDKVIVWHPEVKEPAAVRYAWADNPDCNLVNGAGLPASPFRSEQ